MLTMVKGGLVGFQFGHIYIAEIIYFLLTKEKRITNFLMIH